MDKNKKKILIVDDDNFLLDMYALKFSQNDFEVYTAKSGVHVMEKIKEGLCPDVMLMDIIMPEMNGFEVLREMNKNNICPSCVKIILSNKSEQEDIEEGKRLGVAGYIVKASSTPKEVIDQVVKILEDKKIF